MMHRFILGVTVLGALAGPVLGAGPAPAETPEAEVDPAIAALPPTMRRHGVIGHLVLPDGVAILNADILAQMRDLLVIRSQDDTK